VETTLVGRCLAGCDAENTSDYRADTISANDQIMRDFDAVLKCDSACCEINFLALEMSEVKQLEGGEVMPYSMVHQ